MLMTAGPLVDSLAQEFAKLLPLLADSGTDGSAAQAMALALKLLQARERGAAAAIQDQFSRLSQALDVAETLLCGHAADAIAAVRATIAQSGGISALPQLESRWREATAATQALIVAVNRDHQLAASRKELCTLFVGWEAQDLAAQAASPPDAAGTPAPMTEATLTAYLRDRFDDTTLRITHFQKLAGGFGKHTTIFAVDGNALSGEYVMRCDMGDGVGLGTDCRRIVEEYPVIRAVFEQGFPAPEALWLDTEHPLLPGGDFIVMRRAPGRLGGNVFGAQGEVPPDLADVLAEKLAELHGLAPMPQLGAISDSIRPELWSMKLHTCLRRYITSYYTLFQAEDHAPSPAITALYGWLLDNIPESSGAPCLLHGDVGFHNLLFHEGSISVLVDWEFAHIGHPAEDLGYVKVTIGNALDWNRFMARYQAAGGRYIDAKTLHFFQVWGLVRNATCANIAAERLSRGRATDLKLAVLPYLHIPNFIRGAEALIRSGS